MYECSPFSVKHIYNPGAFFNKFLTIYSLTFWGKITPRGLYTPQNTEHLNIAYISSTYSEHYALMFEHYPEHCLNKFLTIYRLFSRISPLLFVFARPFSPLMFVFLTLPFSAHNVRFPWSAHNVRFCNP